MAFPSVRSASTAAVTASSTSHSVTMPGTVNAGDILLSLVAQQPSSGQSTSFSWPGGWTELLDVSKTSYLGFALAWKIADGTEDGTSVTVTSGISRPLHHKSWAVSGAGAVYALNGTITYATNTNPPTLTPGGGAKDFLWFAIAVCQGAESISSYPTGYTNTGSYLPNTNWIDDVRLAWGQKEANASSEDPASFASAITERSGITVAFEPAVPTIVSVSPASPKPGELVTFTLSGYASAPLSANCSYNSVGLTLEAGATTTSAQAYWPAKTAFQPAGAHVNTRLNTNYNLVIANATDTATKTTQQTAPTVAEHFAALVSGFVTANVPGAAAIGDELWIDASLTDVIADATLGTVIPQTSPLSVPMRLWDISAAAWLLLTLDFQPEVSEDYVFYDTFTDSNGTVPASHMPDTDDLGDGWSAVEKQFAGQATPSGGVTIQSNELSIAADRGVSINIGNTVHVAQLLWRIATLSDEIAFHIARLNDQNFVNAYLTANYGGQIFILQFHNNVQQSPFPAQGAYLFEVGETYLIEFERDASNNAYLRINGLEVLSAPLPQAVSSLATRVGIYANGSTAYIPEFAVNGEIPEIGVDPVLSLDDNTPIPGQTVVGTIDPPLAGAVTGVSVGDVAVSFSAATAAGASFVIPARSTYTADGASATLPWLENVLAEMTDGTTTVSVTLQIQPEYPANGGDVEVPPWVYAVTGAEQGDYAYGHKLSGDGEFDPTIFDFAETEPSIIEYHCWNRSSRRWLAVEQTYLIPQSLRMMRPIVSSIVKSIDRSIA